MFLHLGNDIVVSQRDIVAILDLDTTSISKITRIFLDRAQKSGKVIDVSEELPKSYVIVGDKEEFRLYVSPISAQTLTKRANQVFSYSASQESGA